MIALIRGSADPDAARDGLVEQFGLSAEQAQAILDMRLQRLTALESEKIKDEHADLIERIKELREILGDEQRLFDLIKEELLETREIYGDERRTEIVPAEGEIDLEDLIAEEQMVVSITRSGLHQAAAAVDIPQAEARRRRRDRHGDEGRRLHPAPADLLDATTSCCSSPTRDGSTARRSTSCRRARARPRAGRWSTCSPCARARRCAR